MKKRLVKSGSTRETMTEVAVRLFSENGYTGTTMRDIAKAVGVLPGSLYAHIESKETLLLDIVSQGIARFLAIEQLLEAHPETPGAKLRRAIRAHVDIVAADPEHTLVVFHQWRFLSEPNLAAAIEMRRRYANTFVKIIDSGKAQGEFSAHLDTRIAVFGILGALNWIPEWYSPKGVTSAAEIADRLADTLIFGLRSGPAWASATPSPAPDVAAPAAPAPAARKRVAAAKKSV